MCVCVCVCVCDGHAPGSSVGRVCWATVGLVVLADVDVHALHHLCLHHISIYSLVAGKLCVEYSAARPHGQFDISVPRGKLCILCMNEGLPEERINSPTDGSYKLILDYLLCYELSIPPQLVPATRIESVNRGWKDRKRRRQDKRIFFPEHRS